MPKERPQPQDQAVWNQNPASLTDLAYKAAIVYSGAFTPILRSGFGTKAFRAYIGTLVLMIVYAGTYNCPELIRYLPYWLAMVAFRRITSDRRQHSQYQGYPWLAAIIMRKELRARLLEPWLCFFAGLALMPYSEPLAMFVMGGCVSLLVVLGIEMEVIRSRKRAMHDAMVEAGHMRDLQSGGDGWG
jgi:hypothetical protein